MKIKGQVVSLDLSKELKELDVKQDSVWVWVKAPCRDRGYECRLSWNIDLYIENYSAYSVAELGEMLPGEISVKAGNTTTTPYFLDCGKIYSEAIYYVRYIQHVMGYTFCIQHGSIEANARAKMVIFLIKAGLIKAKEVGKK
jgi:hypothetical protein